jgi:hypothetical protein
MDRNVTLPFDAVKQFAEDLHDNHIEVTVEVKNASAVTAWVRENCPLEHVVSLISYGTYLGYVYTAKFNHLPTATYFKLYWHGTSNDRVD